MKYWDEDLGTGECLQLAAWPHEKMTAIITGVNEISSDLQGSNVLYDLNGQRVSGLRKGVNIVRCADGTTKKVVKR